jgi:hypothetical protein
MERRCAVPKSVDDLVAEAERLAGDALVSFDPAVDETARIDVPKMLRAIRYPALVEALSEIAAWDGSRTLGYEGPRDVARAVLGGEVPSTGRGREAAYRSALERIESHGAGEAVRIAREALAAVDGETTPTKGSDDGE